MGTTNPDRTLCHTFKAHEVQKTQGQIPASNLSAHVENDGIKLELNNSWHNIWRWENQKIMEIIRDDSTSKWTTQNKGQLNKEVQKLQAMEYTKTWDRVLQNAVKWMEKIKVWKKARSYGHLFQII